MVYGRNIYTSLGLALGQIAETSHRKKFDESILKALRMVYLQSISIRDFFNITFQISVLMVCNSNFII